MSDLGFNTVSLILAIIALVPLGYRGVSRRLPARRFQELKKEYVKTLDYFHEVLEEGMLPDPNFVELCNDRLDRFHQDVESLRKRACYPSTFKEQCMALYHGISNRVDDKRQEVMQFQATIVSTSEKHRQELEERKRRLGGRSIFNVRRPCELETFRDLYYGEFNVSLPRKPSSIHSEVAIPQVASVQRYSTLVADTVGEQPVDVEKLFLDGEQDSTTIFSEPKPMRSSRPDMLEAQVSMPIKADALEYHPANWSLIGTSSAAKSDNSVSTTSSTLAAGTPTPFDPETAAELASQLLTIQQQIITVTQFAQQVQERLGSSSTGSDFYSRA